MSEVQAATVDLTPSANIIALITNPQGGGSRNLEVIRDGVFPPQGSSNITQQYDTYTGSTRTEDWIGYQFSSLQTFGSLVFQSGMQFSDGGWFKTLKVQVRKNGVWTNVPSATISPAYAGHDKVNFRKYTYSFPAITGDGIRIDGAPGGSATFISVGELRVYSADVAPVAPAANAGPNQSVSSGDSVTLDGSASFDPSGASLTYAWTQTAGPSVTLSNATIAKPSFTAPSVTATTTLTFSLVVKNSTQSGSPSTVSISVAPPAPPTAVDLTPSGAIIALITSPAGGGNYNIEIVRDGVYPPQGSTNDSQQYDTYTGFTRAEDWFGYQFSSNQTFGSVVFQNGKQFDDGGWFDTLKVQVRQNGVWVDVPSVTVNPPYAGHDGINFETYTFTFPAIVGDAIRIDGTPGGSATFSSVGELRVYSSLSGAGSSPTANAGPNQSVASGSLVTLDGSGSFNPSGSALSYSWTQVGGPSVVLSSPASPKPTFTAPSVTTSTTLTFSLVVQNATASSGASTTTVTVAPAGTQGKKSYQTTFLGTEAMLSEGGVWTTGVDLYQTVVAQANGCAYGTQSGKEQASGCDDSYVGGHYTPCYNDSEAWLSGYSSNQRVSATIHKSGNIGSYQEVELLLRWNVYDFKDRYAPTGNISSPANYGSLGITRSHGYEINLAWDGYYSYIGQFLTTSGGIGVGAYPGNGTLNVCDGAKFSAQVWDTVCPNGKLGNMVEVFLTKNNSSCTDNGKGAFDPSNKLMEYCESDNPIPSGEPGMGFYRNDGGAHDPKGFCFSSFEAAEL